ncbi:MAG: hypothetical protein II453_07030 [Alphaproteobacteria bacterium]|nr:hypothetical protein [Alphaproteobacteria bacterium]
MYKTQQKKVEDYLLAHKKDGATSFEMIKALRVVDVRKCLSRIREEGKYLIPFEWEVSKDGTRYKRYFLKKAPKISR